MKHLTFFICTLSSGGAEHQMSLLANFLVERGYEIDIVTFGDEQDHYPLDVRIGRIRIAQGKSSWRKALAIFAFFLRVKTDCVISFSQRANALMLPAMFLRPWKRVVVGERNFTVGPPDMIEKMLFRALYYRANKIVPNSYSQGNYISARNKVLAKRVKVIPNYTDLEIFTYHPCPKHDVLKIGVFCRYAPQKNYERFLRVVGRAKKNTDVPFEIHWYGATTKKGNVNPDYASFMQKVKELQLDNVVVAHDSSAEVWKLLPDFDLLCLPSLYEGFSNTLSEYICCGRPVIASNVSDNHLMVHEGRNGFLFNPNSDEEMLDALCKAILLSEGERETMGRESRKIAERLFDKEKFVNEYIAVIENKKEKEEKV